MQTQHYKTAKIVVSTLQVVREAQRLLSHVRERDANLRHAWVHVRGAVTDGCVCVCEAADNDTAGLKYTFLLTYRQVMLVHVSQFFIHIRKKPCTNAKFYHT